MADSAVLDGTQTPHLDASADWEIDDLAWLNAAEILGGDPVAFQLDIVTKESDVACADICHSGEHAAAAKYLDLEALPRRAQLQQVVDEALHGVRAVARREADGRVEPVV